MIEGEDRTKTPIIQKFEEKYDEDDLILDYMLETEDDEEDDIDLDLGDDSSENDDDDNSWLNEL